MILDLTTELHRRAFIAAAGEYLTEWDAVEFDDLYDALADGELDGITVCEMFENYPAEDIFNGILHLAKQFIAFHEMEKLIVKTKKTGA